MENYSVTYTYYDKKGRRLSVFCRLLNPTEAEIFVLTCSKQDRFKKSFARKVYEEYLTTLSDTTEFFKKYKPQIITVTVKPEEGDLKTLLNYCKENFYGLFPIYAETMVLAKFSETDKVYSQNEIIITF